MHPLRRYGALVLDVVAAVVIVAVLVRLLILPRLHREAVAAPPVSLAALDHGRFDLGRGRGKVVFLDFWATWCEPCRDSIPLVQHFRRTHPGVVVESIDVGEDPALVRPFAARFAMADVALDPDGYASHAFAVGGYPTMVAIDPRGLIRARWIGFDPGIERAMADTVARISGR